MHAYFGTLPIAAAVHVPFSNRPGRGEGYNVPRKQNANRTLIEGDCGDRYFALRVTEWCDWHVSSLLLKSPLVYYWDVENNFLSPMEESKHMSCFLLKKYLFFCIRQRPIPQFETRNCPWPSNTLAFPSCTYCAPRFTSFGGILSLPGLVYDHRISAD